MTVFKSPLLRYVKVGFFTYKGPQKTHFYKHQITIGKLGRDWRNKEILMGQFGRE